jgi:uncharacterized repeat protein (TIGR02543 family)
MMPKLRIAIFFLLAALSIARAQCGDFAILANSVNLGKENSISHSVSYTNTKHIIFTTSPSSTTTKWKMVINTDSILIYTGASWTLPLENKDYSIKFTVQCGEVVKNIVLNVYIEAIRYTVAFNTGGGSAISPQTVKYNERAVKPQPDPTRTGYTFVQWELGGSLYNFNTSVTRDIELTAKWTATNYSITYFPYEGTIIQPAAARYNMDSTLITLPSLQEPCGYKFDGWFENSNFSGSPLASFIPNANNLGDKSFYAKLTQTLKTPTADLLNYTIPASLTYNAKSISPITVTPKSGKCLMSSNITVLYNGNSTLPLDAGNYSISASIPQNQNYEAAIITLGTLDIAKKNTTLKVNSATAENKAYDATKTAKIATISFTETGLISPDKVSPSDYSVNAAFASENVGEKIKIELTVSWLPSGALYKNYNLDTITFTTAANITKATGYLQIKAPEKYKLSNPVKPTVTKNPFVKDEDIIWEYKRQIEDSVYSERMPNRVGNWQVRASFSGTDNYTGAIDSASFSVERGTSAIIHNIVLSGFKKDTALSDTSGRRSYFVAGTELCNIKSSNIQITVIEPDIILKLGNIPQRAELDENGFTRYELPLNFSKPGRDSLIYSLSPDTMNYTLLLETPVPFDSIAGQKWNNVLFINNNPLTNGGYEFEKYKWFKNGTAVSEMQFYSAGPSSKDTLNSKDIYTVTMHTANGIRLSTCEYNPKTKITVPPKPALAKQVLGINGKTAKTGSEIYNLKGSKTKNTPAGIYIVGENE